MPPEKPSYMTAEDFLRDGKPSEGTKHFLEKLTQENTSHLLLGYDTTSDLVSGAYEHTINMQAKGWPVVAIVLQDRYNGIVLGIHKSKSPNYRSPRDLKGWKVGVTSPGSSTHLAVSNLMVKNGVDPKDVPVLGVGSSAGALAAVKNGMVDAIVNLDPVISKLEMDGDMTLLDAHTISDAVEASVMEIFPNAEVLIHEDPEGLEEERAVFH